MIVQLISRRVYKAIAENASTRIKGAGILSLFDGGPVVNIRLGNMKRI